ncbi:MAG: response regulator transcription factor [Kofleriaceae bacterium]|jgi:DNA-binding NarL/FixJ family response regulator|nr:response regulator transcription factor [Kofleriaceae bacterium]MBP9168849.1 response regulator transcription factor [Kofleriaceae bacterium]MBP9862069.1 response regulator transcription factor [Kofleriaceae bacterium]
MYRVVLVDDHELMREGLRLLLAGASDEFTVVGEASDGDGAVRLAVELAPDLVVLDVAMPGQDGITAAKTLRRICPATAVVALSGRADATAVGAMVEAGARAYVAKQSAFDELIVALRAVRAGRTYVSPSLPPLPSQPVRSLSAREREVARLVAEGLTSKEIADRLGCAVKTVETHRKQVMDKLGVTSVAALTKWAVRMGLTPAE